ncbi:trigger factor, partial [Streptococcus danieliae]|nr:trigger factor [Streptococcus danieliae]
MSVKFENKETNHGLLTFTIAQDVIKPELDRTFNRVKGSLNVPGFRKGHLPRAVFNQRFGEEALYQDTLNALLPAAYEAAVKEAGVEVVAQPEFDIVSMEKGQDWTISAAVVTKPEVKLGDYKNLEVSVDVDKEVSEEEV